MTDAISTLGTGLGVGVIIVAGGRWVLRSALVEFTKPVTDSVTKLALQLEALATALEAQKRETHLIDRDLRDITTELSKIVATHDRMLAVHEAKLNTFTLAVVPTRGAL